MYVVPNASDKLAITHVTVGIPSAFQLAAAEAKPGWVQSRIGQAVTWSGGSIPTGTYATFGLHGIAPETPEKVIFNVLVGDRTGKSTTTQITLEVLAATTNDTSARSLGRTALVVAVIALGLGLAALFAWLYFSMRPPPAPPL